LRERYCTPWMEKDEKKASMCSKLSRAIEALTLALAISIYPLVKKTPHLERYKILLALICMAPLLVKRHQLRPLNSPKTKFGNEFV